MLSKFRVFSHIPKSEPPVLIDLTTKSVKKVMLVKTTEWFTCMGGAARCPMCGVYWCGAVGTVAGPLAQGGTQILGDVPQIQEQIVEMVNCCRVLGRQMRLGLRGIARCWVG